MTKRTVNAHEKNFTHFFKLLAHSARFVPELGILNIQLRHSGQRTPVPSGQSSVAISGCEKKVCLTFLNGLLRIWCSSTHKHLLKFIDFSLINFLAASMLLVIPLAFRDFASFYIFCVFLTRSLRVFLNKNESLMSSFGWLREEFGLEQVNWRIWMKVISGEFDRCMIGYFERFLRTGQLAEKTKIANYLCLEVVDESNC